MKSLQLLDLCFLLLSLVLTSSDCQNTSANSPSNLASHFKSFKPGWNPCKPEHLVKRSDWEGEFADYVCNSCHVKRGENASILCKSNKEIKSVIVKFCSHYNDSCPTESRINTTANENATENGRISLKEYNNSVYYLNFHNVEIFDNRKYEFIFNSDFGPGRFHVRLKVNAPYTIDEVRLQNNTTIVCKASGGFPKSQLYWYDKNGTNLTSSSKLETKRASDGSFNLSSTLHVESPISEIYCCSLNNTTCLDTDFTSRVPTFDKVTSKEHAFSTFIPVAVCVLLAIGIGAAIFHRRKKGANDVNWQRVNKTLPNQREQI